MTDTETKKIIDGVKLFMLDMDGTVYLGETLIDGAVKTIELLRKTGKRICFVTNNSSASHTDYIQKLARLGIAISFEEIWTSGQAACRYLKNHYADKKVYLLGTDACKKQFEGEGICLTDTEPDVVTVAFDTSLDYKKLTGVCNFLRSGAAFIATHPDFNCPVKGGYIPDVGSFLALIQASTGRSPTAICGKPYAPMYEGLAARFGLDQSQVAMVGDRLMTDIRFGNDNGFPSILVLSGETDRTMLKGSPYVPTLILESIAGLTEYL